MIATAIIPGGSSISFRFVTDVVCLWKFLNMAQELILLSLINTNAISTTLIAVYQGGSFFNFNIFDPILSLLPDYVMGATGYNALDDNSQYHPYIFLLSEYPDPNLRSIPIQSYR